jgi:hypothetical protein
MKRPLTFILLCTSLVCIISCTKRSIFDPVRKEPALLDSTTSLLTGQTWVYYEYFSKYDSVNTILDWKTNRTSNTLNLSLNQVKYNSNNTYTEVDQNGNTFNGTWSYLNNETEVQVVNSEGTFVSTIESLTSQRYEWLAANGTYGVMIPKNQAIDTTGGRMQLLTSKTWIYQEYFTGFSLLAPSLGWKISKTNSPLNLSLNVVKYNTDGSYSETDQYGNVYNGTWTFLNNQTETQVVNSMGTFTSTIELLDTARYEWLDIAGNTYGEMIPK